MNTPSKMIQAKELFSNQICPKCGNYLFILKLIFCGPSEKGTDGQVFLKLKCTNSECDYSGEVEVINAERENA